MKPGPSSRAFGIGLVAAGLAAALSGCASRPEPSVAVSPPPLPEESPSAVARQAASEHFYQGKALALAGEADCARLEFHEALEGFWQAALPDDPEDLAFGRQLYESVQLYQPLTLPEIAGAENERPPAEDPRDSLIAAPPAVAPEEVEAAKREVAAARPKLAFDIPIVLNDQVLNAVAFYQFRTPQAFAGALKRSGRYLDLMRGILKEKGLPQDLVYVAMVESAFKHQAHSRAAAHGFWQFIGGTGKRYGLRKSRALDERSDPVKSTVAAARYFKDLYDMFGDWHLAMAAYDAGEGKILRGLQRTGARDYWELSAGSQLNRETRDYVPFVLAAALISKEPARYGFDVVPDPPLTWEVVRVTRPVDLGRVAGVVGASLQDLQILNSELKTRATPHGVGEYALRVPAGSSGLLAARLGSLPAAPDVAEKRVVARKGDTLRKIASRAGVTLAELCEFNDLPRTAKVKRGTVLVVPVKGRKVSRPAATLASKEGAQAKPKEGVIRSLPTPASAVTKASDIGPYVSTASTAPPATTDASAAPPAAVASLPSAAALPSRVEIPAEGFEDVPGKSVAAGRKDTEAAGKRIRYTVRRGDTLTRIAAKYGTSVDAIRRENRLHFRESLQAGRRLTLTLAIAQ